jgi:alpha-galactosidase
MFLKEAPLPYARPMKTSSDLIFNGSQFIFKGLGAGSDSSRISYPQTVILYQGGKSGMSKALQDYQRNFKRYDPESDVIWHSMWGDRNRDGRVNEKFYSAELNKNIILGIDLLYFIDGWQKGISANSVDREQGGLWEGQWSQPDYWNPNPVRFPNGIQPIVDKAKQAGFKTGFWYNPDKNNDYVNWSRDANVLLNFHRLYGSRFFKYDGVAFYTKKGEINLLNAMHKVVQESNGKASIEIDITAGIRTGYYSAMSYGFLFLENRYTDWQKYYPHTTLRNLWQLSHYVDPRRLRMEFLNNERNKQIYGDDLLAPCNYTADYLFASTMFALPMAWLESTGLSDNYSEALKKIIAVYKPNRQAIHEGNILPIGNEPDGFSWTGFISQKPDRECGYIVVFRELNDAESTEIDLPLILNGKYNFELLSGNGKSFNVRIPENRKVKFELPKKQNYAFYRYCRQ